MTIGDEVAHLYMELDKSSKVLDKIDNIVESFQNQLADVSGKVSVFQEKSEVLSTKLANHRNLEEKLHKYIETILLPEDLVHGLCKDDIEENTQAYLEKVA